MPIFAIIGDEKLPVGFTLGYVEEKIHLGSKKEMVMIIEEAKAQTRSGH